MVFKRRMNRLRPIHSVKHIVDKQDAITGGTQNTTDLIVGKDAPVITNTADVEVGCHVYSIFINIQVIGLLAGGVLNNLYAIWYKNPGNNIGAASIPNGNTTSASDFKRQIFHTEMIMSSSSSDDIPQTFFKGVLKIPKVFQTFRVNDKIVLNLFSPTTGGTHNFYVQCIYKEFR